MKNKLGRHEQYLPHYFTILLELIYSGVYSKVDVGRIVCSIGILLIALACIQTGKTRALPWLPLIMLGLIIYGVRDKWHLEVAEKNKVVISKAHTKIKAPKEPTLAKCELEPKWNKPKCNADNKELQDTYDLTLKEYNTKIEGSEIKINRVNSNLTFYEQLPVLIYALISGAIAFVAFKTSEPKLSYSRPRENDTNQIKKIEPKKLTVEQVQNILAQKKTGVSDAKLAKLYEYQSRETFARNYKRLAHEYNLGDQKRNQRKTELKLVKGKVSA